MVSLIKPFTYLSASYSTSLTMLCRDNVSPLIFCIIIIGFPFLTLSNMLIRTNEGTEGTFSHASEATMKLLRENASVLLTILSAVVSDPLYKWSVSPVKARLRQRSDIEEEEVTKKIGVHGNDTSLQNVMINEDKNDAASRAIAKIEEKLQGYENGTTGECQTVEGQVQLLINAARDPDNLCTLYFGWAPWV